MKNFVHFALSVLFLLGIASAQNIPAVDVFGGYSYMNFDVPSSGDQTSQQRLKLNARWEISASVGLLHHLALEGDFSDHWLNDCGGTTLKCDSFTWGLGPRFHDWGSLPASLHHHLQKTFLCTAWWVKTGRISVAAGTTVSDTSVAVQGQLPMTVDGVSKMLRGYDLVVVIGAQVFRYYPYVAGEYLPEGTELLQITADPRLAATAPVGDSVLGDTLLVLEQLVDIVDDHSDRPVPAKQAPTAAVDVTGSAPLSADAVWSTLSTVKPADSPLVTESTSTLAQQVRFLPSTRPASFFATPSGGIGWGLPAAVGIALGDRARGVKRTVVATIGDGSFQYSVQAIWTAAHHRLPIVFVVMRNGEYSILKSFAELEKTPGVPGLDLPELDIASLAVGFGCRAVNVDTTEKLAHEFTAALDADGPTVIVVPTKPQAVHLG